MCFQDRSAVYDIYIKMWKMNKIKCGFYPVRWKCNQRAVSRPRRSICVKIRKSCSLCSRELSVSYCKMYTKIKGKISYLRFRFFWQDKVFWLKQDISQHKRFRDSFTTYAELEGDFFCCKNIYFPLLLV